MNEEIGERTLYVDAARCTGCGACVEVCPTGAIYLVEGETGRHAEVDQSECSGCEACVEVCPEGAILSGIEPVMEGELVEREAKLVPAEQQHREARPAQPVPKALTWLGAALVYAGREILPRVAVSLLDAWDRRANRLASYPDHLQSERPARTSATSLPKKGGRRHRHQRHGS